MCQDYIRQRNSLEFHALRHCQRSNSTTIGLANFRQVKQCADLARRSQGLAFNFAPRERGTINLFLNKIEDSKGKYVHNFKQ